MRARTPHNTTPSQSNGPAKASGPVPMYGGKAIRWGCVLALLLCSPCWGQVQIVPPSKVAAFKRMLPKLEDADLQSILEDDSTMWYDFQSMPPAYQHAAGNGYVPTTFHWAMYNISGDPSDQPLGHGFGGNANREFPWMLGKPGGAHQAPFVDSFKGLWLPKKPDGTPWPVVWFRQDVPARGERIISGRPLLEGPRSRFNKGYGWVFPVGAVLIEALTTRDPQGRAVVFEMRFRVRESDAWGVDLFRPFPTAESLAEGIKDRWPQWRNSELRREAVRSLEEPVANIRFARLADLFHRNQLAFDVTAGVDEVPRLASSDVNVLLTTEPFKSALGEAWRTDSKGRQVIAPMNEEPRHNIVPHRYHGAFMGNDRDGCIKCHESTNQHATVFQRPRGWYGRVAGSDGILSWHPVDPSSVSRNGSSVAVRMRGEFVSGGVVERYNPDRHPRSRYSKIRGLL